MDPIDKALEEWDIISPADIPIENEPTRCSEERKSLAGSIISQIESTVQKVQRAFSFSNDFRSAQALDETVYYRMFDKDGRISNHRELHKAIFQGGGVVHSLRPCVWKHLLNVYPHGLTKEERRAYLNDKCEEYYQLRYRWQHLMRAGTIPDLLHSVTNMVRKDVRRTDRAEKFYSGSDDTGNVRALFNILTTYAVNHESVSYCQGMSDMLSPILFVMKKESEAYVCFCGLMQRIKSNFHYNGRTMKLKFRHLQKMVRFFDPKLYNYLRLQGSLDMIFAYRWLVLDLKREFPFNEMLNLMEVLWASLPPRSPGDTLKLYEEKFPNAEVCDSLRDRTTPRDYFAINEAHFGESSANYRTDFLHPSINLESVDKVKKWAFRVRRESMARDSCSNEDEIKLPVHYRKRKYRTYIQGKLGRMAKPERSAELSIRSCKLNQRRDSYGPELCQSWSCGEVFEEKPRERAALYDAREFLRSQWCYSNTVNEIQLNNYLNGRQQRGVMASMAKEDRVDDSNRQRHGSSDSNYSTISDHYPEETESGNVSPTASGASQSEGYESDLDSKEVSTVTRTDEDDSYDSEDQSIDDYSDDDNDLADSMEGTHFQEGRHTQSESGKERLPPPHVLGDGNPFLLFLCLAMIMNHRTEIIKRNLDFNELGIYFDRFVRKHKFSAVYKNAKTMFTSYLNMGWDVEDVGATSDDD